MLTPADFRTAEEFHDQTDEDLGWLASVADEVAFGPDETPFRRGDPAEHMLVVLDGGLQIFSFNGGQRLLFGTVRAGDISGLLPFSRMDTFNGEVTTIAATRIARVHKDHFIEMVSRMPEVGHRLVARMTDRVRESSRTEQQREKMVSLGKLSAGLAHELNNPTAAIRRSVADLRERLAQMPGLLTRLTAHGLTPDELEAARAALAPCSAPTSGTLTAVHRSEKEDALADWLEDHGVPQAYLVAEVLADEGVSPDVLGDLAAHVREDALADVVLWIEKEMAADRLLAEIEGAAGRISSLVASVKSYTHMDQAPDRQSVDVHAGLDSTLTMLSHTVKAKGIHVTREYGDDVPEVCAYAGEINQVWTNLLDNALEVMGEGGRLTVRTRREGAVVCVHIVDDGPGIPADVQARIFEPFFTTKAPGEGTGLGLDIARRIVTQHEGRLTVQSEPGRTDFEVCLPIEPPDGAPAPDRGAAEADGAA